MGRVVSLDVSCKNFFHERLEIGPGKKVSAALLLFLHDREGDLGDDGVPQITECLQEGGLAGSKKSSDYVEALLFQGALVFSPVTSRPGSADRPRQPGQAEPRFCRYCPTSSPGNR